MNPSKLSRQLCATALFGLTVTQSCPAQINPSRAFPLQLPAAARIDSIGADNASDAFIVGSTPNQTIYIRDLWAPGIATVSTLQSQDFGRSVDLLEPDPNRPQLGSYRLAVVGCPGYQQGLPPRSGRVLVYGLQGTTLVKTWSIVTPQPRTSGEFGYSVSISLRNYAPVVAIGEPGGGVSARGRVYLYTYDPIADAWVGEQTLSTGGPSFPGDEFGRSLDLSGTHLVVGAPMHDVSGPDSGAADLYEFTGGRWVHRQFIGGASIGARTGTSVAIGPEYTAVGSPLWGQRFGRVDVYDHRAVGQAIYTAIGDEIGELGTSVSLHQGRAFRPMLTAGKPLARSSGAVEMHRLGPPLPFSNQPPGKVADWQMPSLPALARFGDQVLGNVDFVYVLTTGTSPRRFDRFWMPLEFAESTSIATQTPGFQGLAPTVRVCGDPAIGHRLQLDVSDCRPSSPGALFIGSPLQAPLQTGLGLLGIASPIVLPAQTNASGSWSWEIPAMPSFTTDPLGFQFVVLDPAASPSRLALSDTISHRGASYF